jgi:YHS domain-containing protein
MALDPICNWEVDPETAEWSSEHKGENYYFCAPGCKQIFDQDPEKWTGNGAQPSVGGGCSCCGGH